MIRTRVDHWWVTIWLLENKMQSQPIYIPLFHLSIRPRKCGQLAKECPPPLAQIDGFEWFL